MEGIIYNCYDSEYHDGEKLVFLNVKLTHYRQCEGYWPDHFIVSTETGKHFMCIAKDQINEPMV